MQCICLLGYCIFPINLAGLLVKVLLPFLPGLFKLILVSIAFIWSTRGKIKIKKLIHINYIFSKCTFYSSKHK